MTNMKHYKIFWFLANKGGTGKTTISVSTAVKLVNMGYKVGILDADISSPSVPRLLNMENITAKATIKEVLPCECPKYPNLKIVSMGTHPSLVGNKPVVWRGERHRDFITQCIEDVAWGDIDYLIVDFPAGLGDPILAIKKYFKKIDGVVLISLPSVVSVKSCEKAIIMAKKLNVPIIGLVSNMSYFVCQHGERHYIFGNGNVRKLADQYGIRFIGEIPFVPELHYSSGLYYYLDNAIIEDIAKAIASTKTGLLDKIKSTIFGA